MRSTICNTFAQPHARNFAIYISRALFNRSFLCKGLIPCRSHAAYPPSSSRFFSAMTQTCMYEWIDGVEPLEKYTKGGFHPIQIGDVLNDRYEVVHKLGHGGWSIVWLAHDMQKKGYVALKVGVADSSPHEVQVLQALTRHPTASGSAAIPRVLDEFRIQGPNGSHPCYTTVPALCTLQESSFCRLFPLDVARALAYELVLAVAYLHAQGFAHGDIYLRNVLVRASPDLNQLSIPQFRETYGEPESYFVTKTSNPDTLPPGVPSKVVVPLSRVIKADSFTLADARLLLSDFGESFKPTERLRLGRDCHTPMDFRPPEAHFKPDNPLSFSADIWSLAIAIWDILGMQTLFSSHFHPEEAFYQMNDILGPMPDSWQGKLRSRREFFDYIGVPEAAQHIEPGLEGVFEQRVQHDRRKKNAGEIGPEETAAILSLMSQMLRFRPEDRLTAQQVLESDWMAKWARIDYKRSREVQDKS